MWTQFSILVVFSNEICSFEFIPRVFIEIRVGWLGSRSVDG